MSLWEVTFKKNTFLKVYSVVKRITCLFSLNLNDVQPTCFNIPWVSLHSITEHYRCWSSLPWHFLCLSSWNFLILPPIRIMQTFVSDFTKVKSSFGMWGSINTTAEVFMFSPLSVCLAGWSVVPSVSWLVCWNSERLLDGFQWTLVGGWGTVQGRNHYILVQNIIFNARIFRGTAGPWPRYVLHRLSFH